MKCTAVAVLLFLGCIRSFAQANPDSCTMEISLLTCAPGTDLYSIFGHTAIRVQDARRGMDIVYNYGTFDDTDPLFYVHFTKGIMNYSLSAETYDSFMMEYEYEHRAVIGQVLNLSCAEKYQLYEALRKNTLDENRFYQYRFHTDNCTTRAARIIESNTADSLWYQNILPKVHPSYRDMIHEYLDPQHQYWSKFGIDMCLGMNLDKKPTNIQAIHFLPAYLFRGLDHAFEENKRLVIEKQRLLSFPEIKIPDSPFTPIVVFTFLLMLAIVFYFLRNKKPLLIFDVSFFSLIGLFGLLITALWAGRVDDVCRNNINVFWALPTHLIAVFFVRKRATWVKYYFLVTAILASVLLIGFPWWPQRINTAVLPILAIIIFRSYLLFLNRNYAEKNIVRGS
ncbi:MAG TPA: DUF4105 domain-containing protein [Puia sp.]|nr:DUF4105 domain-containing protein [Puia sp.]